MEELESKDEFIQYPNEKSFAYHLTDPRNVKSIKSNGIRATHKSDKWTEVNQFMKQVQVNENISTGVSDRSSCVFAFGRKSDAIESLSDGNAVFILDLNKIPHPAYRGSYHTVTKVYEIVNNSMNPPQQMIEDRKFDKKLRNAYEMSCEYWNNLTKIEYETRGGEILINGNIPTKGIVAYYENI